MSNQNKVHGATRGFNDSQAYDAHRPSYPVEAADRILKHLEVANKPGSKIVDLAAGTGKFTELLVSRPEQYEILAVEPLDSMRDILAQKALKGVEVRSGTAAKMDVPDAWADAVVVAQAFHWFAKEEALEEIRRVLKPGGKLAMVWNAENFAGPPSWPTATEWEKKSNKIVDDVPKEGQPRFRDYEWPKVFERQAQVSDPFFTTPIGEDSVSWTVKLSVEGLWDRMNTHSYVNVLQGRAREELRAKFDDIVKEAEGYEKDELEVHGGTYFYWTTRT